MAGTTARSLDTVFHLTLTIATPSHEQLKPFTTSSLASSRLPEGSIPPTHSYLDIT